MYLGGMRDPSRHEVATLHEFCVNHQVPPLPADWNMGGGGGTDGHQQSSGDPVKDSLVHSVKAFQRQGDREKELWAMYADMYLGGIRDPGRHEVATLDEFCRNHNVTVVAAPTGGGGGHGNLLPPPSGPMDPLKESLVQRVKMFQKGPNEQKEAWNAFAGVTRDPARHDSAKLQEFCTMYNVP